ncbi:MAG: GNAT family N-acetyltransferase [Bacteroidales bacterium]|jgi:ribosomal-protein-serine acetyltransferase|nr:GNAT family N-acetyltransferase [Bacteroidales bacterium]MDN5350305.1 ribosomal-protein-serine acetyltransferase [Bacteroidales bacterium]
MTILTVSDDLLLRQIDMADAELIFETINAQRQYLRKWLPFVDLTKQLDDTRNFILSINADQELEFVMQYKDEFAGLIGFSRTDWANRKTEIGYWLSEPFQHKGIVTESVKILVKFAFEKLQLNRVEINCAVGNLPSKKIPQKLGFQFEGTVRDGELLSDAIFVDIERYSLCKKRDQIRF